jgi:ribosomal protein L37AE/L43A
MNSRTNNPEACIVCARRSDGLAVGRPERLGWYCKQCGPSNARTALYMKNMDDVEQRACLKVAEAASNGTENLNMTSAELPAFISWCVKEFAENMRRDIDGGGPPF